MVTLGRLYQPLGTLDKSLSQLEIKGITADSRQVEPGYLFVAVAGTQVDGHDFIDKAIASGACAIVGQKDIKDLSIPYLQIANSADALGIMAVEFYDNPSMELEVVGVTGTNGKTTIVTLLHDLFTKLGYQAGMLSTVENRIGTEVIPSTHTTPDPVQLQRLLRQMADEGCAYCFMEVSSHAIHQRRVAGIDFAGAVFTNLSRDHLDYHADFKEYRDTKKRLFDDLRPSAFSITNIDDPNGSFMLQNTRARKRSYSLLTLADLHCRIHENNLSGLVLEMDGVEIYTRLVGRFNAYNLLAAYGVAIELDQDKNEVLQAISLLTPAEGRFHVMEVGTLHGIVDYAHTPDALDNVLDTINDLRTPDQEVITVVGCGGDRDKGKRPLMAASATKGSTRVIFTSDNPRTEDQMAILNDMTRDLTPELSRKAITIPDRAQAIRAAVDMCADGGIILVAGKGHEKYQIVGTEKLPFDDAAVLMENLKTRRT